MFSTDPGSLGRRKEPHEGDHVPCPTPAILNHFKLTHFMTDGRGPQRPRCQLWINVLILFTLPNWPPMWFVCQHVCGIKWSALALPGQIIPQDWETSHPGTSGQLLDPLCCWDTEKLVVIHVYVLLKIYLYFKKYQLLVDFTSYIFFSCTLNNIFKILFTETMYYMVQIHPPFLPYTSQKKKDYQKRWSNSFQEFVIFSKSFTLKLMIST